MYKTYIEIKYTFLLTTDHTYLLADVSKAAAPTLRYTFEHNLLKYANLEKLIYK